jgi:anti-sigma B factor antagonist
MERYSILRDRLEDDSYAVAVAGEIDLHAAPALKRELLAVVARGGRRIVVDFAAASLADSTPLGVLLAVNKRIAPSGASLSIVCSEALYAFFVRTGLDELLSVVAEPSVSLAPALHAVRAA